MFNHSLSNRHPDHTALAAPAHAASAPAVPCPPTARGPFAWGRTVGKALMGLVLSASMLGMAAAAISVDINKGTQAELEAVKGIGPAMATKIMDERKKAPFRDWADVMERVKGVKTATATKFSNGGLTVNGNSMAQAVTQASPGAPAEPVKKK